MIKGKSQCITAGVLPIEVADLLIHRDNGKHHLTKQGFLVSGSFRRVKLSEVEASLADWATGQSSRKGLVGDSTELLKTKVYLISE